MSKAKKIADAAAEAPTARELHRARRQAAEAKKESQRLHKLLDRAEERLELALSIAEPAPPKPIKRRIRGNAREATAVLMASDWHIEERVDPATVNGRNSYDLDESQRRARRFFDGASWLLEHHQAGIEIRDAVLWLGGDLITGYIHEELQESNALSPTEAILRCQAYVMEGISTLLDRVPLASLRVLCNWGNHGRTTPKRRISTGAKNSFEWLMYQTLAQAYAGHDVVSVHVADGAHLHLEIYDWRVRFTHGDAVRGGGGVGGLSIPLLKKIARWDHNVPADYTVLGHFHQFRDFGRAVVNGSLIGWSPYGIEIGAEYEPPRQGFFLVDRKRGKTMVSPIWVAE